MKQINTMMVHNSKFLSIQYWKVIAKESSICSKDVEAEKLLNAQ